MFIFNLVSLMTMTNDPRTSDYATIIPLPLWPGYIDSLGNLKAFRVLISGRPPSTSRSTTNCHRRVTPSILEGLDAGTAAQSRVIALEYALIGN
jgi:hypothetical protein